MLRDLGRGTWRSEVTKWESGEWGENGTCRAACMYWIIRDLLDGSAVPCWSLMVQIDVSRKKKRLRPDYVSPLYLHINEACRARNSEFRVRCSIEHRPHRKSPAQPVSHSGAGITRSQYVPSRGHGMISCGPSFGTPRNACKPVALGWVPEVFPPATS